MRRSGEAVNPFLRLREGRLRSLRLRVELTGRRSDSAAGGGRERGVTSLYDPFSAAPDFDLESRIRARAAGCGHELDGTTVAALAHHARAVLRENRHVHLTTITAPAEFLERHLGESFEGAAMIEPDARGTYLDLGSGNGYPGLALAAARPGLRLLMAEASTRKAEFLRAVVRDAPFSGAAVLEAHVQRGADLEETEPLRLITSRAMGGWAKILPRLRGRLAPDGDVLVWAGPEAESIARRTVWRKLEFAGRRELPGREQSWIWRFRAK
jgi:16S rRNA G527 N7-methylase RsmG